MTAQLSHAELQELLGAFALDAVDADERDLIGRHLLDCPRCRAEVGEHREIAALLANSGAPTPAGVWERISAALEESPPKLDLARVLPLRAQRSWRRAGAVLAIAAAVVIGVLGVEVRSLNHRVSALQRLPSSGLDKAALAAVTDPKAQRVALRTDSNANAVQAVVLPDGQAYILQVTLPPLAQNRTYQLWAIVGDRPKVSLGLLGAKPTTTAFRLDPSGATLLAITAEPASGAASPDLPVLVSGNVQAAS